VAKLTGLPASTRDTVILETPAIRATSAMRGGAEVESLSSDIVFFINLVCQ